MLQKSKPWGFTLFARRYGEEALLDCLERNEERGVVYHREGIVGDYDEFEDPEELMTLPPDGERIERNRSGKGKAMSLDKIVVHGAREHNLKNIDVTIPRDKLVVLTGLSGSGEVVSGFDTIYAEGQRRVCGEPFFLRQDVLRSDGKARRGHDRRPVPGHLHRPEDHLQEPPVHRGHGDGDLRLPAAALRPHRHPHCPICGREIKQQTIDQIVDQVLSLPEKTRIQVMAPVVRGRKGEHQKEFEAARKSGFVRARVDACSTI